MNWIKNTALALALGLTALAPASAQDFPKGPVKLIVPFPPGGPTDTVARLLGQKLQETWGQPVIVDYKPGAGTVIGADFVAKSAPDGQTIGMVNSSLAVNPTLRKKLPYDTQKDLSGVTQLFNMQLAIVAHPDAPFNNLRELIDYAKKHPGKLNYGTPGAGSTTHLGAELLKREAGFEMQHIAMKGSAPAHTELMGGRLDLVVDPFLSILPYVQGGRMKLIATMGDKRVAGHNYPTVAETIPGFNVGALLGFVAPAGTPKPVLQKIQADTAKALATPDVQKRAQEFGLQVVGSTPDQFDAFIASEMKRWGRIVTEANIQQE
ncbi:MAG: tripartite tricarboxylate transporter substrate binding protein [Hydrogenophaga sp.]|uniref:tripartite tricarboxylate transporter substrate binding protein n=1 Tax=Hydrogenophaga sp. TaxID=1904254 RepID=UPI001694B6FA|nr:tripartite tricarboxylate transporter substrate binding protein [Hydrogenophaga sp.]NIM41205.1 tripartite tricarboxylate transporter substrate binding protein [Hydrogenophaga sp.]NIN26521.1 tripartite tricarboxylate transporter substrate binding protein [Hydrogenophaga sp.]NIN31396.1 tripartite tricarboxylate transporter substrate binding protein [Hydrogenophaga sp.]NIN55451.1 tripartite tricarboxylate transporter substrate binding protein [Hydrogenophaga sp.]NIO51786.1 tripartite tricarbox